MRAIALVAQGFPEFVFRNTVSNDFQETEYVQNNSDHRR
jgi:hypothetical protein